MNFSDHLLSFRIFADPNNDKLNKTLTRLCRLHNRIIFIDVNYQHLPQFFTFFIHIEAPCLCAKVNRFKFNFYLFNFICVFTCNCIFIITINVFFQYFVILFG